VVQIHPRYQLKTKSLGHIPRLFFVRLRGVPNPTPNRNRKEWELDFGFPLFPGTREKGRDEHFTGGFDFPLSPGKNEDFLLTKKFIFSYLIMGISLMLL